jgi:hypothetical protein
MVLQPVVESFAFGRAGKLDFPGNFWEGSPGSGPLPLILTNQAAKEKAGLGVSAIICQAFFDIF